MTLLTKQEIETLLGGGNVDRGDLRDRAPDLARTALDALARLEDADAAQALVLERAVAIGADIAERTRPDGFPEEASNAYHSGAMDVVDAIRALADPSGVAALAALRKRYDELYQDALADAKSDAQDFESDLWKMVRAYLDELNLDWLDYSDDGITADEVLTHIRECMDEETRRAEKAEAERDDLRARLAAAEGRVAALTEAGKPFLTKPVLADNRALIRAVDKLRAALATVTPPADTTEGRT